MPGEVDPAKPEQDVIDATTTEDAFVEPKEILAEEIVAPEANSALTDAKPTELTADVNHPEAEREEGREDGQEDGDKTVQTESAPDTSGKAKASKSVPIVVFVNKKSGGQKGERILDEFLKALPKEQVYNLTEGGLDPGIEFCYLQETVIVNGHPEKARIIAAGGDGTVGWVVSGIDKHRNPDKSLTPVAHLPLGTGNDMARSTGWGGGYDGGEAKQVLSQVRRAKPMRLDRWKLHIQGKNGTVEGEKDELMFYNYFSVGADAHAAYIFHHMREQQPEKFTGRTRNKYYYVKASIRAFFAGDHPLNKTTKITVDDESVRFGNSVKTIVGLNIQSYMGGSDIWGTQHAYSPSCCCLHPSSDLPPGSMGDGKIDLMGIRGNVKQGFIKSFNCTGVRMEQGRNLVIDCDEPNYVQADGEPWKVDGPFKMTIDIAEPALMLTKA
eukprot:CAMPEP_0184751866 /NCGR_PEP_ID=MMETSP0315-20130426/43276_1 /TAXON_ID=101924 /ORGANISM="Rhodosorus marinus, Strain UTEX LB 2760" /LENGTH=439 /DNA_ID=CAMNT_0027231165 /DNA_START=480 /DNA_END=1799 /DNA_ORIENTATION=-